LCWWFS